MNVLNMKEKRGRTILKMILDKNKISQNGEDVHSDTNEKTTMQFISNNNDNVKGEDLKKHENYVGFVLNNNDIATTKEDLFDIANMDIFEDSNINYLNSDDNLFVEKEGLVDKQIFEAVVLSADVYDADEDTIQELVLVHKTPVTDMVESELINTVPFNKFLNNEALVFDTVVETIEDQESDGNSREEPYIPPTDLGSENNFNPSSEEDNELRNKRPRKRIRNPKKWAKALKKVHVNSGKSYKTKTGRTVNAKVLGNPCGNSCKLKCTITVTEEERQILLDNFLSLTEITRKRNYLTHRLKPIVPKYRYAKTNRSNNIGYYFMINNEERRVCKAFFMSTLCVGNTMLRTVLKKTNAQGFVEDDLRGRHGKQKQVDVDMKEGVRNHINSFSRIESHYCRKDNKREFIDGNLDLATMYREYIIYNEALDLPTVKKHMYDTIFKTEFNIGFFRPKKDQCAQCEQYTNSNEGEQANLREKYDLHIEEKKMSRIEKEKDVAAAKLNNDEVIVCSYDLEAVFPLPSGHVSNFYYKRKLNVYNFTIYNIPEQKGFCFMWHEGVAKRGANEIGTCIFQFLKERCIGKHVIFYSDNCVRQNKNRYIMSMYLYAVKIGVLSITHKFLIVGHTQNEGDAMHSRIEAEKQRALRGGPIYIPPQLVTIVTLAKKTGHPYIVNELETSEFLDLKQLSQDLGNNFTTNDDGENVRWQQIKVFQVQNETPDIILYKHTYDADTPFKSLNIRRKLRVKQLKITLKKAYKVPPNIPFLKKKDLLDLCKSNLIPKGYHAFFESLKSGPDNLKEKEEEVEMESD